MGGDGNETEMVTWIQTITAEVLPPSLFSSCLEWSLSAVAIVSDAKFEPETYHTGLLSRIKQAVSPV